MDQLKQVSDEYHQKFLDKLQEASSGNPHVSFNLLQEWLDTMLTRVHRQMPKEEFRNIDNTPKHLLHMTDEDFLPKSPEVLQDELTELIKEARSKIKPV